uniref:BY PROTMAP: gi/472588368/gb/EMS25840.1/ chloroperoxidase-like protein [Rhodosporidium toruloides NP11] gi/647396159/emb/CDR38182.1/ RHTO0S03e05270g1_1 [Rhodosporidium toruloides] n=1 Tax=Rhodotorula toruloides TaxID=5286 RepID=A0A0K3C574_RHOTO
MVAAPETQRQREEESPTFTQPIFPSLRFFHTLLYAFKVVAFLVTLHASDLVLLLLNLVSPSRKGRDVSPPAFSPSNPPSFTDYPFLWALCKTANWLGKDWSPEWLWSWTHWSGLLRKGKISQPMYEEGWSRSPCPALNALANHGIIPRDGRHLTPSQLSSAIQYAYNLSPTLAIQLLSPFEPLWRDRGWFDLSDLGVHNLVEHDGSLTREDNNSPFAQATDVATQATPSKRLIDRYFPPEVERPLTWQNFAAMLRHRRLEAREHNPQFVYNTLHRIFASGNAALEFRTIGDKIQDHRDWLGVGDDGCERFPRNFHSGAKDAYGYARRSRAQLFTAMIELAAGPIDGTPRMKTVADGVEAQDGWNAMLGEAGTKSRSRRETSPMSSAGGSSRD